MAYNILIVDDSNIVRKVLIKTFSMTDLKVSNFYEAANGREGLDKLKGNWVDLVFLDINMPVMNGMEFMQQVRADSNLKDTPVIVVSTEGSKERKDEMEKAGVKAFLRKPVTPEHLSEIISNILGNIIKD